MKSSSRSKFEIYRLGREHELASFRCGNPVLDEWLLKYAWANQLADSARTYVALDGQTIVGYYSLAAGSVHKQQSPERIGKGLANHPIGIVLLARLAVDETKQGKGLGKALLFDALTRASSAAEIVAARAVMVHAIDDAARRFYEYFGFEPSPSDPFQLLLLLKDIRRALTPSR